MSIVNVPVGVGFTKTVKEAPVLTQLFAFFTVMVPVYVAADVLAGTDIEIGLTGKPASVTATKLFAGAAFHVML